MVHGPRSTLHLHPPSFTLHLHPPPSLLALYSNYIGLSNREQPLKPGECSIEMSSSRRIQSVNPYRAEPPLTSSDRALLVFLNTNPRFGTRPNPRIQGFLNRRSHLVPAYATLIHLAPGLAQILKKRRNTQLMEEKEYTQFMEAKEHTQLMEEKEHTIHIQIQHSGWGC
jgi:hypothetical protein